MMQGQIVREMWVAVNRTKGLYLGGKKADIRLHPKMEIYSWVVPGEMGAGRVKKSGG